MTRSKKDSLTASVVTAISAALILMLLFFGSLKYDKPELARDSVAEIMPEEETFLEPEILRELGEEESVVKDAPAPASQGAPAPAAEDNLKKSLPTPKPEPKKQPDTERQPRAEKPQPVKAPEPSASAEEKKEVSSRMADKFSPKNGTPTGTEGSSGAGGTGVGMTGVADGRRFLGCPRPDVALRNPVRVTVDVVIDASGHVTSAKARAGADASIRRACEQAARAAKWSEKRDAPPAKGTITFRITPRK